MYDWSARVPRCRWKRMKSSTAGWLWTSRYGTGWITQVMRDSGHARFSALATGSTWTASPSALSMMIPISRGGSTRDKRGARAGAALAKRPSPIRALEGAALLVRDGSACHLRPLRRRAAEPPQHAEARERREPRRHAAAVQVQEHHPERPLGGVQEDVLEVQVGVRDAAFAQGAQQRAGRRPGRQSVRPLQRPRAEQRRGHVMRARHERGRDVGAVERARRIDGEREHDGGVNAATAHLLAGPELA